MNNETKHTEKPTMKEVPKNTTLINDFEALYKEAIDRGVGFMKGIPVELMALKNNKPVLIDNVFLKHIYDQCSKRKMIITKEIKNFINNTKD